MLRLNRIVFAVQRPAAFTPAIQAFQFAKGHPLGEKEKGDEKNYFTKEEGKIWKK